MNLHRAGLVLLFVVLSAFVAPAQAPRPREAVLLETDGQASRRLETAREQIKAGQWDEAITLLRQAAELQGEKALAVGQGRYLNVQTCCDMLLATLSPEALKTYRQRLDPQARRWFEAGRTQRDQALLDKVIRQAFVSSFGDDALLLSGDLAWERGELATARLLWTQLLPPERPRQIDGWPASRAYPDTNQDLPLIRARLVLCSLMEGNLPRAQRELDEFTQRHSDARGAIAGRTGILRQILADVLEETTKEPVVPPDSDLATFAGTSSRDKVLPRTYDLGGNLWSVALPAFPKFDPDAPDDDLPRRTLPTYFPVVIGNIVLVCDEFSIYALNLHEGTPAFPVDDAAASEPDLDDAGLDPRLLKSRIYKLPPEMRPHPAAQAGVFGVPAFSLTISHGCLYARLGSVTHRHDVDSKRSPRGFLVCLDLKKQGKPVRTINSDEIAADGGGWTFEGTPVVADGRAYVGLRRHRPQGQVAVACYDAHLERLLWLRRVATGTGNLPQEEGVEVNQQLLTAAGGRLYYNTNLGVVAALDLRDGAVQWLATYEHVDLSAADLRHRQRLGPNPCIVHNGVVYVAPYDANEVLAIDADWGEILWKRSAGGVPSRFTRLAKTSHCLLGVSDDRLFVGGGNLWSVNLADEAKAVQQFDAQDSDPDTELFGRGLLAGSTVYTATREKLFVRDAATGRLDKLPANAPSGVNDLTAHGCPQGGNLVLAHGVLLVAQPDRLTAIGELATLKKQFEDDVAHHPFKALPRYQLALVDAATGVRSKALAHLRDAGKIVRETDAWDSLPLSSQIISRQYDLLVQLADQEEGRSAANKLMEAAALEVGAPRRTAAWLAAANAWLKAKQPAETVAALQPLFDQPDLGDVLIGSIPARLFAQMRLQRVLSGSGRSALSVTDALAESHFQSAQSDPQQMESILRRFPLARAAGVARLNLAQKYLQSDQHALAMRTWLNYVARTPADARGSAAELESLALVAEKHHQDSLARGVWQELARRLPDAVIASSGNRPARDVAAERLAANVRSEPDVDPAERLVRAWSVDLPPSSGILIPEVAEGFPGCVLVPQAGVICIDLRDGHRRWTRRLNREPLWAGLASGMAVVADDFGAEAFDVQTGDPVWQCAVRTGAADASNPPETATALGSSWRLSGDRLFRRDVRGVSAWSLLTGELLWSWNASGSVQTCWQATSNALLVQTRSPNQIVALSAGEGLLLASLPGSGVAWSADPVAVALGRFVVVVPPAQISLVDVPRQSVAWETAHFDHSAFAALDVLGNSNVLLAVNDGLTLMRLQPETGQPLWPSAVRAGADPVVSVHEVGCCDAEHVYIPAGGILRCFSLDKGRLLWEQSLGDSSARWTVRRQGRALVCWPASSTARSAVVICDPLTGDLIQRMRLENIAGKIDLFAAPSTLVLNTGKQLIGLRTPAMSQIE